MVKMLSFLSVMVMFLTLIYMSIAVCKELGVRIVVKDVSPLMSKAVINGSAETDIKKIFSDAVNPFRDGETLTMDDLSKND